MDVNYVENLDSMSPITNCVFMFVGGPICMKSKLHETIIPPQRHNVMIQTKGRDKHTSDKE